MERRALYTVGAAALVGAAGANALAADPAVQAQTTAPLQTRCGFINLGTAAAPAWANAELIDRIDQKGGSLGGEWYYHTLRGGQIVGPPPEQFFAACEASHR